MGASLLALAKSIYYKASTRAMLEKQFMHEPRVFPCFAFQSKS